MADELTLSGKRYTSSKRAAEETGYAQDYIGQLARGGHIDAQRVGGLWYVSIDSLRAYKTKPSDSVKGSEEEITGMNAEHSYTVPHAAHDEFVSFDGKDYISASRASKITGYNQDYVGQLARSGKILARQVGNRWFVERSGIVAHKEQKDALLAAVQAQSVGIVHAEIMAKQATLAHEGGGYNKLEEDNLAYTYHPDKDSDLIPSISESRVDEIYEDEDTSSDQDHSAAEERSVIPIRRSSRTHAAATAGIDFGAEFDVPRPSFIRKPRNIEKKRATVSDRLAMASAALTVVIVLSFGISLYDEGSVYASARDSLKKAVQTSPESSGTQQDAVLGAAAAAFNGYLDLIEGIVEPGISYSE